MAADVASLTDDEKRAAIAVLGEQVNQLTMAQEVVRASLTGGPVDAEKHATFSAEGQAALDAAVRAAPQRVRLEVTEAAEAEAAAEEPVVETDEEVEARTARIEAAARARLNREAEERAIQEAMDRIKASG